MAKLDEFGRPIYESAEEYNKAKKTGNTYSTYQSPEGDAYQHRTIPELKRDYSSTQKALNKPGMKKGKKFILILTFFIIGLYAGIILVMYSTVKGVFGDVEQEIIEDFVDVDDSWTDDYGDDSIPLPDGFSTFSYKGEVYSLPMGYEDLSKMGIKLEQYDEDSVIADEQEEYVDFVGEDGILMGMIRISNFTGEEITVDECNVEYFSIENPAVYNSEKEVPEFTFGNGLTFDSSYEEFVAYLGEPYYQYRDSSGDDYSFEYFQWQYFGDDEFHSVSVSYWEGKISFIDIEKKKY